MCDKNTQLIAIKSAPILNISDFEFVFGQNESQSLKQDEKGHIRALEFIALPGTIFTLKKVVEQKTTHAIYQVRTKNYPSKNLYLDSRFVKVFEISKETKNKAFKQQPILDPQKILNFISVLEGTPYLWGGNCYQGIAEMLKYYPSRKKLSSLEHGKWILKGIDCSGLLYQATNGFTPRNTNELFEFGTSLPIDGLKAEQMASFLQPLDLIVFSGHVIIVLDAATVIESREGAGVVKTSMVQRLKELLEKKQPSSQNTKNRNSFLIKRWIK